MNTMMAIIMVELGVLIYAVLWIVGFLSEIQKSYNARVEFFDADEEEDNHK